MSSVQRGIAAWLIERPWRAAIASAALGALSPQIGSPLAVVAGAMPVLVDLKKGFAVSVAVAGLAAVPALWMLSSVGLPVWAVLASVVMLFFAPVFLSELFRRTQSLNLCFQVSVLIMGLLLVMVHAVLEDPVGIWVESLTGIVDSFVKGGLFRPEDADTMIAALSRVMWSALAASALIGVLCSLFLGRWWQTVLESPGQFSVDFQRLRLGLVLGAVAALVLIATLLTEAALVRDLAMVVMSAAFLQGLAAAHRARARGTIGSGWLLALYLLLIPPFGFLTAPFIAVWGLADNWVRSRAVAA